MPDEETDDIPDTYRPRETRYEQAEVPAPGGGTREVRFRILGGTEYTVLAGEEADERLGFAPVNNVANLIRESAIPGR